jgi:multidrug efflux pump subunit AcrA (membrane-fusion protein)
LSNDPSVKNQADANIALAQRDAAQAQADLYKMDIDRSVVKAEIDGEVLQGDLRDKKGSPVKLGDEMMVVGQPNLLRGELRVGERDIQDVHVGKSGKLAITSLPADRYPFKVERVVPTAEAKEGSSFFKVFVTFDRDSKDWPKVNGQPVAPKWLPDMEGEARVDVEPASLGWKWTHRLVDFVRLKLWI